MFPCQRQESRLQVSKFPLTNENSEAQPRNYTCNLDSEFLHYFFSHKIKHLYGSININWRPCQDVAFGQISGTRLHVDKDPSFFIKIWVLSTQFWQSDCLAVWQSDSLTLSSEVGPGGESDYLCHLQVNPGVSSSLLHKSLVRASRWRWQGWWWGIVGMSIALTSQELQIVRPEINKNVIFSKTWLYLFLYHTEYEKVNSILSFFLV